MQSLAMSVKSFSLNAKLESSTRKLGNHSTKPEPTLEIIDSTMSLEIIRSASSKINIVFVGQEVNVIGLVNVKRFNVNMG